MSSTCKVKFQKFNPTKTCAVSNLTPSCHQDNPIWITIIALANCRFANMVTTCSMGIMRSIRRLSSVKSNAVVKAPSQATQLACGHLIRILSMSKDKFIWFKMIDNSSRKRQRMMILVQQLNFSRTIKRWRKTIVQSSRLCRASTRYFNTAMSLM